MGLPQAELFLDDHRGVYIPRDFARSVKRDLVTGVSDDQYATLENPECDLYWEVWDEVCSEAVLTTADGVRYHLYQDGALWLVPDGMAMDDHGAWYWPVNVGDRLIATGPGKSLTLETGWIYTVIDVSDDSKTMDLESPPLDLTIAALAPDLGDFRPRLLAVAEAGKLPEVAS